MIRYFGVSCEILSSINCLAHWGKRFSYLEFSQTAYISLSLVGLAASSLSETFSPYMCSRELITFSLGNENMICAQVKYLSLKRNGKT